MSDDGLQHRGLVRWPAREGGRDIEFVVRDERKEGNRFLLPAGPLREPATRERDATLFTGLPKEQNKGQNQDQRNVITNDYFLGRRAFVLKSQLGIPYQLNNRANQQTLEQIAKDYLPKNIVAIAGIGNPQRFFDDLKKQGITGRCIALPDHTNYTPEFFSTVKAQCILITEKDAVKCLGIADERIWVVPMSLRLPEQLMDWMQSILQRPDPRLYNL